MDAQQELQELAYRIPYHYLPVIEQGRFSQHQYWSWGYRYLGRLQITLKLLAEISFQSLLDIGCGDGRFLREVQCRFGGKRLLGIDYSEEAVRLARSLNPELKYEVMDICQYQLDERFDVVTLLEVIEHIPCGQLPEFLSAVTRHLNPGGWLILSTPHTNTKLEPKHYQHFNSAQIREFFQRDFDPVRCVPFDYIGWPMRLFLKLLGGSGQYFIITHAGLNTFFFRCYMSHCLCGTGEARCHRIAAMAQKRSALPEATDDPGGKQD
jgi:SAM-dependent methyltransferase